jgi:hypothetical protein
MVLNAQDDLLERFIALAPDRVHSYGLCHQNRKLADNAPRLYGSAQVCKYTRKRSAAATALDIPYLQKGRCYCSYLLSCLFESFAADRPCR